jgi:hypothetical protein
MDEWRKNNGYRERNDDWELEDVGNVKNPVALVV